jgi:hypothetical protein
MLDRMEICVHAIRNLDETDIALYPFSSAHLPLAFARPKRKLEQCFRE